MKNELLIQLAIVSEKVTLHANNLDLTNGEVLFTGTEEKERFSLFKKAFQLLAASMPPSQQKNDWSKFNLLNVVTLLAEFHQSEQITLKSRIFEVLSLTGITLMQIIRYINRSIYTFETYKTVIRKILVFLEPLLVKLAISMTLNDQLFLQELGEGEGRRAKSFAFQYSSHAAIPSWLVVNEISRIVLNVYRQRE